MAQNVTEFNELSESEMQETNGGCFGFGGFGGFCGCGPCTVYSTTYIIPAGSSYGGSGMATAVPTGYSSTPASSGYVVDPSTTSQYTTSPSSYYGTSSATPTGYTTSYQDPSLSGVSASMYATPTQSYGTTTGYYSPTSSTGYYY
jgi:hypothetical protein